MADGNYRVYLHTFPHGRKYVGITSLKPEIRWKKGNGYIGNKRLINAIKKYGWENIDHQILFENIDKETALRVEMILIWLLNSNAYQFGYNRSAGGEGASGWVATEETRQKMSLSHRGKNNSFYGRKHSPETIEKLRLSSSRNKNRLGKPHSEETKLKLSAARIGKSSPNKGKPMSETAKKNLSNIRKRQCESPALRAIMSELNPNRKQVYQYTTDGLRVRVWDGRRQAEREFRPGKTSLTIGKCCSGKTKTAYGYVWSFNNRGEVN